MSDYTRWYRDGTVSVTAGSKQVVGSGTFWLSADLHPGDIFKLNGVDHEIASITDNTNLTLAENFSGVTASGKAYGRDLLLEASLSV